MEYTITTTIKTVRESIMEECKQTIIDEMKEMDDEDLIISALEFLESNADTAWLVEGS